MYIHGAVDGASLLVIYCEVASRNNAGTQLEIFERATNQYGYPWHIRTDRGLENSLTWERMLEVRGRGTRAVIVGPSTRNTRIERLWLTVGVHKIRFWRRLFQSMEDQNGLDIENDLHLWALHYIFVPRLNQELSAWIVGFNNHRHRSDRLERTMRTPQQMFIEGRLSNSFCTAEMREREMENFDPSRNQLDDDFNNYGVFGDRRAPAVEDDVDWNTVQWPEIAELHLTDELKQIIQQRFDPLQNDNSQGVNLWFNLVNFLERNL